MSPNIIFGAFFGAYDFICFQYVSRDEISIFQLIEGQHDTWVFDEQPRGDGHCYFARTLQDLAAGIASNVLFYYNI